jgi:hypothetical protein
MAYCVGFDLDETIGYFSTVDTCLYFLDPYSVLNYRARLDKNPPSEELSAKLATAFDTFVVNLLDHEPKIEILRPGILDICKRIMMFKDQGKIRSVIVYSNNGNLISLKLATKMIEKVLDRQGELFCNHVDWYAPQRMKPINNAVYDELRSSTPWLQKGGPEVHTWQPGRAIKTIRVLKESFNEGTCLSGDVDNDKILFFDDMVHPNIKKAIGAENYFNVNPYKRGQSLEAILECFMSAMTSAGLIEDEEYFKYIDTPALGSPKNIADVEGFIQDSKDAVPANQYFINDTSRIINRLDLIFGSGDRNGNFAAPGKNNLNKFLANRAKHRKSRRRSNRRAVTRKTCRR